MIIDTHIHCSTTRKNSGAELLSFLDESGIDKAIVCGWEVLLKRDDSIEHNKRLAKICQENSGRLAGLATVHLVNGKKAVDEAQFCIEQAGFRGFKVHPWMQGESIFDETMYAICQLCAQYNTPIMFHDGTPPCSMSSQIGLLAKMFPETKLILGHGGILHFWEEAIEVARQNSNVYIMLCGGHPLAMQKTCEQVDSDRIIFGTDYLGDGNGSLIKYRKQMVDNLPIEDSLREKIYGKNALKLYNINHW